MQGRFIICIYSCIVITYDIQLHQPTSRSQEFLSQTIGMWNFSLSLNAVAATIVVKERNINTRVEVPHTTLIQYFVEITLSLELCKNYIVRVALASDAVLFFYWSIAMYTVAIGVLHGHNVVVQIT